MTAMATTNENGPTLERLAELAQIGMEAAVKAGAQQADTCAGYGRSVNAVLEGRSVHEAKLVVDGGVGIRAFVDGGMGYAFTMQLDEDAVRGVAERAARLARTAQPDPHFVSLPGPAAVPDAVPGLYDERIARMQVPDVVRLAEELAELVYKHEPAAILRGSVSLSGPSRWALHNSLGVEAQRETTYLGGNTMVMIKASPDDMGSGWENDGGHTPEDYVAEQVAAEAVR